LPLSDIIDRREPLNVTAPVYVCVVVVVIFTAMLLVPVTLTDAALNEPLAKLKALLTDNAPIPLPPPLKVPLPVIVSDFPPPVIAPNVTVVPCKIKLSPSVTAPYVCVPVVVTFAAILLVPVMLTDAALNVPLAKLKAPLTDNAPIPLPPLNTPLPVIVNACEAPVIVPSVTVPLVEFNVLSPVPPSVTAPYVCAAVVVISAPIVVVPVLVTLILFAYIAPDNVT